MIQGTLPHSMVQLVPGETLHLTAPKQSCTVSYRWPIPASGKPPVEAAQANCERQFAPSHPAAAKGNAAASAAGRPALTSAVTPMFRGCRAFFLVRLHVSILQQRFQVRLRPLRSCCGPCAPSSDAPHRTRRCAPLQERGGVVHATLAADTTHIIATSSKEGFDDTEAYLEQCFRPPSDHGGAAGCKVSRAAQRKVAEQAHFVTTDWISDSLERNARLAEAPYADAVSQRAAQSAATPAGAQSMPQQDHAQHDHSMKAAAQELDGGAGLEELAQQQRHGGVDNADVDAQVVAAAAVMVPDAALTPLEDASCEATIPGWGFDRWRPRGWTSAQWGEQGIWLEPYDKDAVNATLLNLYRHYNRLDLRESTPDAQAAASDGEAPATPLSASPLALRGAASLDGLSPQSAASAASGSPCGHVACACAGVCIVEELDKTTRLYVRGRGSDVHRMRATQGAMATLRHTQHSLRTAADVDALGLGA